MTFASFTLTLCHTFRNFVTLFCRKSPLYDTFLYVKVRFITHYLNEIFGKIYAILYVSAYNPTYKIGAKFNL